MDATAELIVRDGTGGALVPARKLILTRAPEMARLAEMTPRVAAFDLLGLDNHDAASETLREVRMIRKHVEAFHDLQKGPLNEVRAVALDLEKRDVGAWKALETGLGAKLLAFDAEVERQRKAEQDRLTREALRKPKRRRMPKRRRCARRPRPRTMPPSSASCRRRRGR